MEHLNKQQVVLTCILVALVTSVATAITIVSLTDESGLPTQTIYRVIETSIDKVADKVTDTPASASQTPVKENPKTPATLASADIAQLGAKSLVRIYDTTNGARKFTALGVAVGTKDGVLASALLVSKGTSFVAVTPQGEVTAAFVRELPNGLNYFTLGYPVGVKTKVPTLDLKGLSTLRLGASVIAVGGKESGDVVSIGIVSELKPAEGSQDNVTVVTDMTLSSAYSGFLLFDTSGNLVAIEKGINEADHSPLFLSASVIKKDLAGLL